MKAVLAALAFFLCCTFNLFAADLNVGILVLEHVYNSELMAPYDVFHHTKFHTNPAMKVFTISPDGKTIHTYEGIQIQPDYDMNNAPQIDVLVIPSAEHNLDTDMKNEALKSWIRKKAESAQYVVTLCDGAFMLATTGLLDGKNATTFPTDVAKFRQMFPQIKTLEGYSFVQDGKYFTSQGGAKSYDVAMYLVSKIYSDKVAKEVGDGLILPWPNSSIKFFK
ncbi:MAG: glutamine amidotransferase [Acidobacteria bacterium]|nr:MAG: glutamine amidotransferase [Acidobacteriota bacterium]